MGQAKKRGTFEQRRAEAIERDKKAAEIFQQETLRRRMGLGNRQGESRLARIAMAAAVATGLSIKIEE